LFAQKLKYLPRNFLLHFLLSLLLLLTPAYAQDLLRVHFIDVGYGDAILIESPPSFALLIDAGERKYANRLWKYLSAHKIQTIDVAVITHPHKNHFEGLKTLLKKITIHQLWINGDMQGEEGYEELIETFSKRNIPIVIKKGESRIRGLPGNITLEILHPEELSSDTNGNSLVLWLGFGETHFLFTADIGEKEQAEIILKNSFIKQADCVQIPHHGGPVHDQFAAYFEKAIFVMSTGKNQWGLPHESDLEKLTGEVFRTDRDGTIVLESDGRKVSVLQNQ